MQKHWHEDTGRADYMQTEDRHKTDRNKERRGPVRQQIEVNSGRKAGILGGIREKDREKRRSMQAETQIRRLTEMHI